jgi:endoglucanase
MIKKYYLLIIFLLVAFSGCKKDKADTEIAVETISINKSTLDLIVGNSEKLTATILPKDAINKNVTWQSSNSTIASVSSVGLITALSEGPAVITVTSSNGITAQCNVTITAYVAPPTILLKAIGNKVINEYGDTVMLRGTNLGSWLVQEDWMTGNTCGYQKKMIETLTDRFGSVTCEELIDLWENTWITETDIDNIRNLGFNCVRVPFTFMNLIALDDYSWKSDAFDRLDWILQKCGERNIYVIFDMHGAPGSQSGSDHTGIDGGNAKEAASEFFFGNNAASNQAKFYEIWEAIAQRYVTNKTVAGYDLLNEPYCTYRYSSSVGEDKLHSMLYAIYNEAYKKIRAIDANHIIIMEATWDPWDLPKPSTYSWTNVMYEYHNYEYSDYDNAEGKQISSMKKKLTNIKNYDTQYKVPNLLGEFCYMNSSSAWEEGMALLNTYGAHWTTWNYKVQANYGNWGIYNCSTGKINISTATESEIRSAWKNITTSKNTTLANILSTYATGKTTF